MSGRWFVRLQTIFLMKGEALVQRTSSLSRGASGRDPLQT